MKVKVFQGAATAALSVTFAGVLMAQSSSQQPPASPTPTSPPTAAQQPPPQTPPATPQRAPVVQGELRSMNGQTVTLSGCLMREADVPGRTPNIAERAGIGPDFILTNVQMRSASPSGATATPPSAPSAAAPSSLKVKLTKVDTDKVKENVNKQVEVTGRLDVDREDAAAARPPGSTTPAPAAASNELPQLEVASIKVVGQTCPQQ